MTRIIYIRTDAIGDAILSAGILSKLKNRWPKSILTIVCQTRVAEIYSACPDISQIISFDRILCISDENYRRNLLAKIAAVSADVALCPVYSREVLTDLLVSASRAQQRIGMLGDLSNQSAVEKKETDSLYTQLIASPNKNASELDRKKDFLVGLGIDTEGIHPCVWLSKSDDNFAQNEFINIGNTKVLAFFPGAQYDVRVYGGYRPILEKLSREGWQIFAFGSHGESVLCETFIKGLPEVRNYCGRATLLQTAALMRRCSLGLGSESGLAHLCSAVGLRHAVVLGGGHFGRFCPTSPLCTAAVLPLGCFMCNWQCRHTRPHCVKDLDPAVLSKAVDLAQIPSERPRLVLQKGLQFNIPELNEFNFDSVLNLNQFECHVIESVGVDIKIKVPINIKIAGDPKVSIVVPSTGRASLLDGFLSNLPDALAGVEFEVIGIAPQNDFATRSVFDKYHCLILDEELINVGRFNWAKAMNAGFRVAKAQWVMYASDDIRIDKNGLAKALAIGELTGPEIGGLALMESTPSEAELPPWHFRLTQGKRLMINFGIIRREAFEAVGGFSESFRFYSAAWDFCLKLHAAGRLILPIFEARCFHEAPADQFKKANVAEWRDAAVALKFRWEKQSRLNDPIYPIRCIVPGQQHEFDSITISKLRDQQQRGEESWSQRYQFWQERLPEFRLLVEASPQNPVKPRTTVFCAVWHRDPDRIDRLKGHQECLDAQLVPIERIYVFDGDDIPPDWLKGRVLRLNEPLGLYEAWNVALSIVRTPYVMNLNLDDRLNPDAVAIFEKVLDSGADMVGGDWKICYSQVETDRSMDSTESHALPFSPEWPPTFGSEVRLGSGTGERGTYGPACAWRMSVHETVPRYPWRFKDHTPIRIIGDSIWWRLLIKNCKILKRLPVIIGRYYSHPNDQAEFRNPAHDEETMLANEGVSKL
jgi:ADP-heptose:LPS heptosyltransferase/glycosyltransferase involved in cell wall biosynthesis